LACLALRCNQNAPVSLVALLLPVLAMPLLLLLAPPGSDLPSLDPRTWPWWFHGMAIGGSVATVAGALDWRFHRHGGRRIAPAERRAELAALALGAPLFALLTAASLAGDARPWLLPTMVVALAMTALIMFDETRFHRACGCYESALHRLLVFGNGFAFACWFGWCSCREIALG
jgi:hypothetical protein